MRAALLALLAIAGAAPALAQAPTVVRIGHSYTSERALGQPATFVLVAEQDRPLLTTLDAAVVVRAAIGSVGGLTLGVRAAAGSARASEKRVFGALVRYWRVVNPAVVSLDVDYEADGGLDVQKGVLSLQVTPIGVPSLRIGYARGGAGVSWRPWLGIGYGNVLRADASGAGIEPDGFLRVFGRAELNYRRAGAKATLEATGWLAQGSAGSAGYLKGALSVPIGSGFSIVASGEAGRQPPRFVGGRRLGVGLGYSLRGK
jgi:hypothetical protein